MRNICRWFFIAGFAAVATLSGCTRGGAEFHYYEEAYRLQSRVGDNVLDHLAMAERKVKARAEQRSNQIPRFKPEDASYILFVGDPPITASIRNSLNSIAQLNLALIGLAQGESANVLNQRANEALSFILNVTTVTTASTKAVLSSAIDGLFPALQQLAQVDGRRKFEMVFLKAYPDIKRLLATVRTDITPLIFEVHRESVKKKGDLETRTVNEPIDEDGLAYLESVRKSLAAWVILLEQTEVAMDRAVAVLRGNSSAIDQTALAAASNDLSALAKAIEMELSREPNRG